MPRSLARSFACLSVLVGGLPAAAAAQATPAGPAAYRIQLVRNDTARRVDVLVDGQPFTAYIYPTTVKKPVLYPPRTATGIIVTPGLPLDPPPRERAGHPPHRRLWFNY